MSNASKNFYDRAYQEGHQDNYGLEAEHARVAELKTRTQAWLQRVGLAERPEASILEVGCGMAYLKDVHPGWHGVEYSGSAVERVKARDGASTPIREADAQTLPFPSAQFDGVFSWAVLEHVPDPNRALLEIDRVLRPGGTVLLAPAWNCRSWTVRKLREQEPSALTRWERVQRALIPLRESVWFRAARSVPMRVAGELDLRTGRTVPLRFRTLHPRWDLIEKLGHVTDDDAVAEIDSHAAICFFLSRRYEVPSHPTPLARMTARNEPVVARKPSDAPRS